jgi:hypothetical protein
MWRIRMFFRKVKNMIRWFPIIWKDEDWDDHFIFEILKFKLKNQAKYIGDRGFHTRAKRDAEIMMLCVRLIDKIQTEYYNMESSDYEESKFNFIPIEGTTNSRLEIEHISDNLDDYFNKYPLVYKEVVTKYNLVESDGPKIKHRIAMYMSRINHDRARKLLFKLIEENIERWWD